MRKKLLKIVLMITLTTFLFSTAAFAKNEQATRSLVALGDSITYGYNLENNNNHVSRQAFPFIIGEKSDYRVRDLAVPGLKSDALLFLVKYDVTYRDALKHADRVTLDIGSNDLLQTAIKDATDQIFITDENLPTIINNLLSNLQAIVGEIENLTDAPIVVYNIYNPFQQGYVHMQADTLLASINGYINTLVTTFQIQGKKVVLVDAYTAIGDKQFTYILLNDIHPNPDGQKALATAGLTAFESLLGYSTR
jgi:lysophospholipase L1-like esterase